jgi:LacI family transcriptional regulator
MTIGDARSEGGVQHRRVLIAVGLAQAHFRRLILGCRRYVDDHERPWLLMDFWDNMMLESAMEQADGVIAQGWSVEAMEVAKKRRLPVVLVSGVREPVPGKVTVLPDNVAAGRRAAEHFLSRGFRDLAFLGVAGHHYAMERRAGFAAAAGAAMRQEWLRPYVGVEERRELGEWLRNLAPGTGLFVSNDIVARSAVRMILAEGRRVPEDLAVLGVDDDEIESALSPVPLSSVDVRGEAVGWAAAAELDRLLGRRRSVEGVEAEEARVVLVPPGEVMVRRSSDILRVGPPALARALAVIRGEGGRGFSPAEVVAASGVSRRTLERMFRRELGRCLEAELRRSRLERARGLLADARLSIGEVAERAGFVGIYHFSRLFKEHFGESPTRWRRRLLGAKGPGG